MQVLVARTTTRSPSAMTSSILQVCSIGPMCAKRARIPSGPEGRSGGPPTMRQFGAVVASISAIRPSLRCRSQLTASSLLASRSAAVVVMNCPFGGDVACWSGDEDGGGVPARSSRQVERLVFDGVAEPLLQLDEATDRGELG